jgi:Xaa-Pro aminopeptidase
MRMQGDGEMKIARVRRYLKEKGYTGLILLRQDNFAWITSGGLNRVVIPSAEGIGAAVITEKDAFLVSQVMDGERIQDEELNGLPLIYVPLRWYEESVLDRALKLAGEHPAADVPSWADCPLPEIYDLHTPYTALEIARFHEAGRMADEVLFKVAVAIEPSMAEYEAEAMLLHEFTKRGAIPDVVLVGSDERLFKYRHPTPTGAKLGRYVLLTPAVRYKGLHCNIARSVYFGDRLPEEIALPYEAVRRVTANCMALCRTGASYRDILEEHKALLAEFGYPEAWQGHYPGGRTGYFLCQANLSLDPSRVIGETEAFEWFITVPGAKSAELTVKDGEDVSVASNTGPWPSSPVTRHGRTFQIPEIMMR